MTGQYQNLMDSIAGSVDGGGGGNPKKPKATVSTPLAPSVDVDKLLDPNQKNYSSTKDPDTYVGRNGVMITRKQYQDNQKTNLAFNTFEDYANWVGGWAHPEKPIPTISPYYRTYPYGKISGADIYQLYMLRDPKLNEILGRNIAGEGEVPQYGPEDADLIRKVIAHNNAAQ